MYYTSDIKRLQDIIAYVKRLNEKDEQSIDNLLLPAELKYSEHPNERNVQFRKNVCSYGKFRFKFYAIHGSI